MPQKELKFVKIISAIAAINFIINLIVYFWGSQNIETTADIFIIYSNVSTLTWSIIASSSFILTMKTFNIKTPSGKVWLALGLGLLLWTIGDIIWAIYELILDIDSPFPSVADYSFTLGYPLLVIGLLLQLNLAEVKLPKKELIITIILELVVVILSFVFILIPIIMEPISEDWTISQSVFSLIYPIGDLILFPLAIILIFKFKGGEYSKVWFMIAAGFLIAIAADLIFSYWDWNELESTWYFVDHLFVLYYMVFAIASQYLMKLLKS